MQEITGRFPRLTDEQKAVIEHASGPLAVIAGPGSGKTTTIILRAINLLASRLARPQDLVITTFSREAARDLWNRFFGHPAGRTLVRGSDHDHSRRLPEPAEAPWPAHRCAGVQDAGRARPVGVPGQPAV